MRNYKPICCHICGNVFKPATGNAKYCSDPCRKKGARIKEREWKRKHRANLQKIPTREADFEPPF